MCRKRGIFIFLIRSLSFTMYPALPLRIVWCRCILKASLYVKYIQSCLNFLYNHDLGKWICISNICHKQINRYFHTNVLLILRYWALFFIYFFVGVMWFVRLCYAVWLCNHNWVEQKTGYQRLCIIWTSGVCETKRKRSIEIGSLYFTYFNTIVDFNLHHMDILIGWYY